jgi:Tfp pilus assembly protein PilZ
MNAIAKSYIRTHLKNPTSKDSGEKNHPDPRKYSRRPYLKSVFFSCGDQTYTGLITNVSRGGVFIETTDQFFFGQSIELVISNSRIGKGKRIPGWIVHLSQTGIGVTFKRVFERRSGKERRRDIDRRSGSDRRQSHRRKNRRKRKTQLGPIMNYYT